MEKGMILGLAGFPNSGRDTIANILVEKHGFTRYAFADKLREMALDLNPWIAIIQSDGLCFRRLADIIDELGWDKAKRTIPEVRECLQNLGEKARNHFGQHIWIDPVYGKMWENTMMPRAVITDFRYPNEEYKIRRNTPDDIPFHLLRVVRPGVEANTTHVSEAGYAQMHFSYPVNNDGTLEDLEGLVAGLVEMVEAEKDE